MNKRSVRPCRGALGGAIHAAVAALVLVGCQRMATPTGVDGLVPRFHVEGLKAVKIQGRWGFVDLKGRMVIAPQYTSAGDFSEGLLR